MQKLRSLTPLLVIAGGVGIAVHLSHWKADADDAPVDAAAAAEPVEPVSHPDAVALLHAARQRLFGYTSVRSSIRESVHIGEHRFEAQGSYIAGPFNPLPQLRLEYQVRVGDTVGILLEVCDGQILRTQKTLRRIDQPPTSDSHTSKDDPTGPETTVTRRDVRKILDAVRRHGPTPETILQAELGIGGLPALLTSLERSMVFDAPRNEPLAGRPCHVLQASWKPEYLAQLSQQFQYFGRNVHTYLPAFTRVHLDAETLFPLRITYWPEPAESGPARPPLLTLEFTDVRLNEGVSPLVFEFPITGADETDITDEFIEAIEAAAAPAATATGGAAPAGASPAAPSAP
jgi:hypothetical protein